MNINICSHPRTDCFFIHTPFSGLLSLYLNSKRGFCKLTYHILKRNLRKTIKRIFKISKTKF